MSVTYPTYTDADLDTVARTLWGEARGESKTGKIAVAWVIKNRVLSPVVWWGKDYASVCRAKYQFSCWNSNDPNFPFLAGEREIPKSEYLECEDAALLVLANYQPDITLGATHYYAKSIKAPAWTKGAVKTVTVGSHFFFKDVP
ncbi:cell wall hydrolase [Caballeronia sp. TF1N1]|uniref:cell wall hydrolase n=1 Tax=Caballeronia sp. TF1N1 TaxID=2878153 RepID=UPI001FD607FE|nr:cell wall hydrolase [Caballeronia sp. TF1N1]